MAERSSTKLIPRKKNDKRMKEIGEDGKSYYRWSPEEEIALAGVLKEERRKGHKAENGWKPVAFNTAAGLLSTQFKVEITADNVRNCVKNWKKIYGIVTDILSQSGFSWDASKKMITVEEETVWQDYVKSHKEASSYRYKVIVNWDDIVDLCAKDRANGVGAETGEEAAQFMSVQSENDEFVDLEADTPVFDDVDVNDIESPPDPKKKKNEASSSSQTSKKKPSGTKDILAASVSQMAASFQQFIDATAKTIDPLELYNEVNGIPNLSEDEQLKALAWFMENTKQFEMLKAMPMERKKSLVLTFLSKGTQIGILIKF